MDVVCKTRVSGQLSTKPLEGLNPELIGFSAIGKAVLQKSREERTYGGAHLGEVTRLGPQKPSTKCSIDLEIERHRFGKSYLQMAQLKFWVEMPGGGFMNAGS
jgi:hypothetical protein